MSIFIYCHHMIIRCCKCRKNIRLFYSVWINKTNPLLSIEHRVWTMVSNFASHEFSNFLILLLNIPQPNINFKTPWVYLCKVVQLVWNKISFYMMIPSEIKSIRNLVNHWKAVHKPRVSIRWRPLPGSGVISVSPNSVPCGINRHRKWLFHYDPDSLQSS